MKVSFRNVGHYFAVVGRGLAKSAELFAKLYPAAQTVEPFAEVAEKLAGIPQPVIDMQAAAMGAYGHVAQAINDGAKRNPDGTLPLPAIASDVVDAVQATMGVVDAFGAAQGIAKPVSPVQPAQVTA